MPNAIELIIIIILLGLGLWLVLWVMVTVGLRFRIGGGAAIYYARWYVQIADLRILNKRWYFQISDLKSVQKLIGSDQRSEHSKACCHDGSAVTAAGLLTISIPTAYHRLCAVGQVCSDRVLEGLRKQLGGWSPQPPLRHFKHCFNYATNIRATKPT